jgi:hypothetical protein
VRDGQKTRKCPGCNKTVNLKKVIILSRTDDIEKAVLLVQKLKLSKMKNKDKKNPFKSAFENRNEKFLGET